LHPSLWDSDSSKMARLMLLVLVLPIAMVEMSTLRGVDLKVTTVTHRPFITPNNLSSGDRYQGLLVDMLRELSNMLGFTFTIHDNADRTYGKYVGGQWKGMIGEVVNGEADIALADMTVTEKREEVVDFTHPFLYIGLGVIGYRGSAPRSLQQLAEDHSVKIGAFCCGSTAAAFANSTDPLYQKIWARMQEDPENMMTNSNEDGVDKVLANRGGYVYIMESVSVDYEVARNCRLTEVGKRFMPRSYALALAQGSPHREELSRGILRLQESGKMEMLAKKWIGLEGSGCAAQQEGILNWLSGIF